MQFRVLILLVLFIIGYGFTSSMYTNKCCSKLYVNKKKRQRGDCPVEYSYLPDYKIPNWVWKKVFSQNKKTKMSKNIEDKWWRSYEKRLK